MPYCRVHLPDRLRDVLADWSGVLLKYSDAGRVSLSFRVFLRNNYILADFFLTEVPRFLPSDRSILTKNGTSQIMYLKDVECPSIILLL